MNGAVIVNRPLKRSLVSASAACVLLLTGCGVAPTQFSPGVAAEVGNAKISTDEVDELTDNYCGAVDDQIATQGDPVPLRVFKSGIAQQLVVVEASKQLAEEYGVEASAGYRAQVTAIGQDAAALTGAERQAYIDVQSASAYIGDVLTQVGAAILAEEGQGDASEQEQLTRGDQALSDWTAGQDVSIDPRYGLAVIDGQVLPADTDVSFASGAVAKAGQSDEPDPAYLAALTDYGRCG